jgi:hypothetical protein
VGGEKERAGGVALGGADRGARADEGDTAMGERVAVRSGRLAQEDGGLGMHGEILGVLGERGEEQEGTAQRVGGDRDQGTFRIAGEG